MTDLLLLGWLLVTLLLLPLACAFLVRYAREWRAGAWREPRVPVSPLLWSDVALVFAASVAVIWAAPSLLPFAVIGASALVFLRHERSAFGWWGLRRESFAADLVAGGGLFFAAAMPVYIAAYASVQLCGRLGIPDLQQDPVKMFLEARSVSEIAWFMVYAVVVAPLCEEIFFRGVLYPFFRRSLGRVPAAALASVLFGVSHWHLPSLVPLTLFGAGLALAYERTGRLGTPIAMHATLNLVTCFNLLMMRAYGNPLPQ